MLDSCARGRGAPAQNPILHPDHDFLHPPQASAPPPAPSAPCWRPAFSSSAVKVSGGDDLVVEQHEYDHHDVLAAIQDALRPRRRRQEFLSPGLAYRFRRRLRRRRAAGTVIRPLGRARGRQRRLAPTEDTFGAPLPLCGLSHGGRADRRAPRPGPSSSGSSARCADACRARSRARRAVARRIRSASAAARRPSDSSWRCRKPADHGSDRAAEQRS